MWTGSGCYEVYKSFWFALDLFKAIIAQSKHSSSTYRYLPLVLLALSNPLKRVREVGIEVLSQLSKTAPVAGKGSESEQYLPAIARFLTMTANGFSSRPLRERNFLTIALFVASNCSHLIELDYVRMFSVKVH